MGVEDSPVPEMTPLDFEHPPLVEVVLGVQFEPLGEMSAAHLGAFWQRHKKSFPRTEDRAPLPATFEQLEELTVSPPPRVELDLLIGNPLPRSWFISASGDELLQLQRDRLLQNWRRAAEDHGYPRYPALRQRFEEHLRSLLAFVEEERLGPLVPNQCEVVYINHIVADSVWASHDQADRIFTFIGDLSRGRLGRPEHVVVALPYRMHDSRGVPRGRLHVEITPGNRRPDGAAMYSMNLTARGAPAGRDSGSVLELLDLGREWILRAFSDLTTDAMHRAWGRKV